MWDDAFISGTSPVCTRYRCLWKKSQMILFLISHPPWPRASCPLSHDAVSFSPVTQWHAVIQLLLRLLQEFTSSTRAETQLQQVWMRDPTSVSNLPAPPPQICSVLGWDRLLQVKKRKKKKLVKNNFGKSEFQTQSMGREGGREGTSLIHPLLPPQSSGRGATEAAMCAGAAVKSAWSNRFCLSGSATSESNWKSGGDLERAEDSEGEKKINKWAKKKKKKEK